MSRTIRGWFLPFKQATISKAFFIPGRQGALAIAELRANPG